LSGELPSPPSGGSFKFLLFCGAVMLVGIMFLAWLGSPPVHSAIGRPLPEMFLEPLVGAEVPLEGKVTGDSIVVLVLWGPWSEDCGLAFEEFAELVNRWDSEQSVRVISVVFPKDVLDIDELRSQTEEFLEQRQLEVACYVDVRGKTGMDLALLMPYGSLGFPTTIVADQTGEVIEVIDGYQPNELRQLSSRLAQRIDPR
jgi:hypothetical protein